MAIGTSWSSAAPHHTEALTKSSVSFLRVNPEHGYDNFFKVDVKWRKHYFSTLKSCKVDSAKSRYFSLINPTLAKFSNLGYEISHKRAIRVRLAPSSNSIDATDRGGGDGV